MRNENFIIHSWQARVAPRKKKQSGYGIFYVSDFEILCSRLDKSRMLTFMNRRIRTRMFGGVGGVVLKPPYPNRPPYTFYTDYRVYVYNRYRLPTINVANLYSNVILWRI